MGCKNCSFKQFQDEMYTDDYHLGIVRYCIKCNYIHERLMLNCKHNFKKVRECPLCKIWLMVFGSSDKRTLEELK